jgi:Homeodomain-like domain
MLCGWTMRTTGSPAELERRRRLAVRCVKEGHSPAEVAEILGVDARSIRRWLAKFQRGGSESTGGPLWCRASCEVGLYTGEDCPSLVVAQSDRVGIRFRIVDGWPSGRADSADVGCFFLIVSISVRGCGRMDTRRKSLNECHVREMNRSSRVGGKRRGRAFKKSASREAKSAFHR